MQIILRMNPRFFIFYFLQVLLFFLLVFFLVCVFVFFVFLLPPLSSSRRKSIFSSSVISLSPSLFCRSSSSLSFLISLSVSTINLSSILTPFALSIYDCLNSGVIGTCLSDKYFKQMEKELGWHTMIVCKLNSV